MCCVIAMEIVSLLWDINVARRWYVCAFFSRKVSNVLRRRVHCGYAADAFPIDPEVLRQRWKLGLFHIR